MATEELYKVTLIGLQKDKEEVLNFLQEKGFMHLDAFEDVENLHGLDRDRPSKRMEEVVSRLLELEWMDEHLRNYATAPLPEFPGRSVKEALKDADALKGKVHKKLSSAVEAYNANQDEITTVDSRLSVLEKIPFDLPQGFSSPRKGDFSLTHLFREPETDEPVDVRSMFKCDVSILRDHGWVLVQGLPEDSSVIEQAAHDHGLQSVAVDELETDLRKLVKEMKKRKDALAKENTRAVRDLKTLAKKHYADIVRLKHELSVFHDRHEAAGNFLRTEQTFVLSGYIPAGESSTLRTIHKRAKVHVLMEGVSKGPSKLRNLPYVRSYEFVTKMFGVPEYGRVDPTLYISVFLPLFFGFMFADVGYGILLALSSWYLLSKATSRLPILKNSGIVLMTCSATTVLFGFLFGSFFGDLIPLEPWLFDAFINSKWILVSSLAIGLVHINLGILTGMYERARAADLKGILYEYVSLLALQAGGAMLFLGYWQPGWILMGIAVTLLILKSGLMGLMDTTGFLGTWFSYARLLALSLATGGIALGVNIIAGQLNDVGLLGPLLFIIFAVLGHLFNFVLNVLGSAIHSVRLHYIEFFSQWYEGQGVSFNAFTTERVKETI